MFVVFFCFVWFFGVVHFCAPGVLFVLFGERFYEGLISILDSVSVCLGR